MRPTESFIGQPIRALQTMLRVLSKNDPSHPNVIPDGIYGPETMAAVSAFQRKHGLPVTGVTNQETWDALVSHYLPALVAVGPVQPMEMIFSPRQVIKKGDRDSCLYLVQGMLQCLSDLYGSVGAPSLSGILDDATADSLASFQQLCRLPMTGELDRMTWKHLALQYPLAEVLSGRLSQE